MKHIFAKALIACLLLLLAACSSGSPSSVVAVAPSEAQTATPAPQKTPEPAAEKKQTYVLSNEVIVDNDECSFTITKVEEAKNGDAEFKVLCENKTDKTLMFALEDGAVNGYMLDPFWATEVASGKKSNSSFTIYKRDLNDLEIPAVEKLEFGLRIYDSDDWTADNFVDDSFTVFPTGISEEEVTIPNRWHGNNELTCVDDENTSFIILGSYMDDVWGYTLAVYLENKTDIDLMYSWDNVSVNGFMVDPFWATNVTAGNRRITTINFYTSSLEENEITSVDDIEFQLRIYDEDNWMADNLVDDMFTYTPIQ